MLIPLGREFHYNTHRKTPLFSFPPSKCQGVVLWAPEELIVVFTESSPRVVVAPQTAENEPHLLVFPILKFPWNSSWLTNLINGSHTLAQLAFC